MVLDRHTMYSMSMSTKNQPVLILILMTHEYLALIMTSIVARGACASYSPSTVHALGPPVCTAADGAVEHASLGVARRAVVDHLKPGRGPYTHMLG